MYDPNTYVPTYVSSGHTDGLQQELYCINCIVGNTLFFAYGISSIYLYLECVKFQ